MGTGAKLTFKSVKEQWGSPNKVIGCGYNPSQKKVFFTVDAQLVHEIHCKTDDFGSPLYPTLAANTDVTVLVNLGQSPFKYSPANLQRTPNPCFINGTSFSPSLGYEDSRELFSMGRIDSQWLQRSVNNNTVSCSIKAMEYDQDSDADLFEIVLDTNTGKSPYAIHHQ
ncbi:SPla/RYanodine receptor (SPRY) domain-containing protein [Striga hermonthica]|uniref:SPla/RYanodine receptor (SPRY) domain-containing protein n=1 Tax=Striga hermonthica TaxID=68872 RepID=A0A9N7MQF8_STRHE|nr:SPla/RYanodine receptor (SPRY) domain-containing protein [Striga hermonthica]